MKKFVIAAGLLVAGVTTAAAQWAPPPPPGFGRWERGRHNYEERNHNECQRKAWRLNSFRNHSRRDGFVSRGERAEIRALERDLDRTCGRLRWR